MNVLGFHLLDWGIVIILALSVLSAFGKGLLRELFSLAGLIAGLIFAASNYQPFAGWLVRFTNSEPAADALSFLLIVFGVMLLAGILGRLVRWMVSSIGLGWLDRILGGAFGFFRGCLVIAIVLAAVVAFLPRTQWIRQSELAPYFLSLAQQISAVVPADLRHRIYAGTAALRNVEPVWM